MAIYLHNTMSHKKELFVPQDPTHVTMYLCGPTAWDTPHLGNARSAINFDVLYRLLLETYGQANVRYARNITDIDDKIIAAAKVNNTTIGSLTVGMTQLYYHIMRQLNVKSPTVEPKATDHIPQMISLIETLLRNGYAYASKGHVLFDTTKINKDMTLSKHELSDLHTGYRIAVEDYKRNPNDFVLWKPAKPGEPSWESPWSSGRMGWHTECVAMINEHLGYAIDIHAGGNDLIFPHHDSEICQNHAAHGVPLANYWLHNGMLLSRGKKMSKTEGNFITVEELLKKFPAEVIRLGLLQTHYRAPLDFDIDRLHIVKDQLDYLYRKYEELPEYGWTQENVDAYKEVKARLEDDLDTAGAFNVLYDIVRRPKIGKSAVAKAAELLGILSQSPDEWFGRILSSNEQDIMDVRNQARAIKDWATSDRLRIMLDGMGIIVEDKPTETTWRRK